MDNYVSVEEFEILVLLNEKFFVLFELDWSVVLFLERRLLRSLIGRIVIKGIDLSYWLYKSVGSVKFKFEDVGGGFRLLFCGFCIDIVL